jgi:hypothetical protein
MRVTLSTCFTPAECTERLAAAIDQPWAPKYNRPVYDRLHGTSFWLCKRKFTTIYDTGVKIPLYTRSIVPALHGELSSFEDGTEIRLNSRRPMFLNVFIAIWFAGVIVLGGCIVVGSIIDIITGSGNVKGNPYLGIIVPGVMMLLVCLCFARANARGAKDNCYILEYLQKVLEAKITAYRE